MKAVLANRIFLETDRDTRVRINKELTYTLPPTRPREPNITIRTMRIINDKLVSIPVGREDLIPSNYEIVDKRVEIPAEFPKFKFELRSSQQDIYDDATGNCIINAFVSFGKTFTALAIAGKLKQKTLIVTHTVALRNQWEKEIKKVYGIEPGIIGSGKFDIEKPIVVANIQTLNKYIKQLHKSFGLLILDECHHCPARTFSAVLDSFWSKYKIGLSGTLKRKDGRHVLFKDFFGGKVYQPPKENYLEPEVHIYNLPVDLPDGRMPWATRVNAVAYNEEFQKSIALIASKYAADGHKVLVVSDRVDFLESCAGLIGNSAICFTGKVKSQDERDELLRQIRDNEKDVLCGTRSIFSEGLSESTLSCVILATPINNDSLLVQLVGRIIRKLDDKLKPIVVDIHLQGNTARRQAKSRIDTYIEQSWEYKFK